MVTLMMGMMGITRLAFFGFEMAANSVWLQGNVGEALTNALTEVAVKQPGDPIEYLAYYLLAHTDNLEEREKVS